MVKLFSKNSNLCDHNSATSQTDGQTDGQTTCDRNTALCTKVYRAVKTVFLVIGLIKQFSKIENSSLNTTHSARNLGFIFDEQPSFSDQISSLSKS